MPLESPDFALPSGRSVHLRMPNLYQVLASSKGLPNPALAAVLRLLDGEGTNPLREPTELEKLQQARANIRGLYEIAALCLVEPALVLDGEPTDGQLGPADLPYIDLEAIYWRFFRTGDRLSRLPAAAEPEPAADDRPDRAALWDAPGDDLGSGPRDAALAGIPAGPGGALGRRHRSER